MRTAKELGTAIVRRLTLREKRNPTPEDFNDVPNDELRGVLESVKGRIVGVDRLRGSSLSILANPLGVKGWDVNNLYTTVLNNGVVAFIDEPVAKGNAHFLDRDGVFAFATVAWARKQERQYHGDPPGAFWTRVVGKAREGLGPNYLVSHIHDAAPAKSKPATSEPETSETPKNETLAQFMDRFRRELPMPVPVWMGSLNLDNRVRTALGLTKKDMEFLMKGVRVGGREDLELIDPLMRKVQLADIYPKKHYDDLRMDALAAIAWSMRQILAPPFHFHYETVDWQKIARRAKEELMLLNPLEADHIHVRNAIPGDIDTSPVAEAILEDIQAGRATSPATNESKAIEDGRFREELEAAEEEPAPAVGNTDATSGVIFNESSARRTIDDI